MGQFCLSSLAVIQFYSDSLPKLNINKIIESLVRLKIEEFNFFNLFHLNCKKIGHYVLVQKKIKN